MKRRSKIWLIFLVIGIVCTIITKCKDAKAEGWTPEDWLPDWIQTEEPFDTPAPLPTPSPDPRLASEMPQASDPVDERGVSLNANRGSLGYKTGYYVRNSAESTGTITWTSVNGGGTTSFPLTPWGSYHFSNFTSVTVNNSAVIAFNQATGINNFPSGYNSVSARRNGISLELRYSPNQALDGVTEWTNDNSFDFYLAWPLSLNINMVTGEDIPTLGDLGISSSTITTEIPVTVLFGINTSGGAYYWLQTETTVSGLYNFNYHFDLDMVPDDIYVNRIDVHIVVNYIYRENPLYYKFSEWYAEHNSAAEYYPGMVFVNLANPHVSLSCSYTESAKNRSFLQKLIEKIFLPSSEDISAMVLDALGDPSEGGTGVIISMRENLYNLFNNSTDTHTLISLPSISVPINGTSYQFFNGYVFDLKSFYNMTSSSSQSQKPIFSTLMDSVRTFNSVLIFSAFFSSVWAMVCRIFGLHLWQGVGGEDIDEHDNEE